MSLESFHLRDQSILVLLTFSREIHLPNLS